MFNAEMQDSSHTERVSRKAWVRWWTGTTNLKAVGEQTEMKGLCGSKNLNKQEVVSCLALLTSHSCVTFARRHFNKQR